jgi:hypothetical protein
MSERDVTQELVLLFDSAGGAIEQDFLRADFDTLCSGDGRLAERAGETVKAVYVLVAPGLRIAGLAFFLLPVDREGSIDQSFNVPLPYLVEHAGIRGDFGIGDIKTASRGQCPVPWLALKLWEPDPGPEGHVRVVQRAILLNRVGLRSMPPMGDLSATTGAAGGVPGRPAIAAAAEVRSATAASAAAQPRLGPREEPVAMEQGYLEQIRKFRAEILELKAALRAEQERSRRLEALLRGGV